MRDFFLHPNKPIILTKNLTLNNRLEKRQFLFYSNEEHQCNSCISRHKFTIYFWELLEIESYKKAPFETYQNYSLIVVKRENEIHPTARFVFGNRNIKSERYTVDFHISPKSWGLGSIILNHLIEWGKHHYPDALISQLYLSSVDEGDLENKIRRDRLYSKIGLINFDGTKALHKLTPLCTPRGFEIINLHEYLKTSLLNSKTMQLEINQLKCEIKNLKTQNQLIQDNSSSIFNSFFVLISAPIRIAVYCYCILQKAYTNFSNRG